MTNKIIDFFRRWGEGIKKSTAEQQLLSKCFGLVGTIFGLVLAMVVMLMRGAWYLLVFMFFLTFLQGVQYVSTWQQYKEIKKTMKEITPIEEDLNNGRINSLLGNKN